MTSVTPLSLRKMFRLAFGPAFSGMLVWAASGDLMWGLAAAGVVACILEGVAQVYELGVEELRKAGILPPR